MKHTLTTNFTCDGPDCNASITVQGDTLPQYWHAVICDDRERGGDEREYNFCCAKCLRRWDRVQELQDS